ncbi:flagellar transcriptional regulator FlhC [Erwinia pyrifoliae]|uniref:Flagellar transcriptional regulator FlhC n=1 Tax=Erwinia pyrifoliae TaxID=79967 RepID=A0ABY5XBP7_ERWPY|nr:flagellar transcriptional regulator FlhC [Erwinia pyrifoliae]AUX73470.1 flagellar transcriptional regulator FlhC [Erwinia pyrifoliae]MCA8876230.1 flagellar transcriptional regulator FlhC [Erwinia pyrifoliae]MCT2386371.1 flagellar transcriptional regulator FlhC [Erwinia pyrifoliae]MCU8588032.1 flagellar transcriptional regulator FlhC [Erwinia pyrifoliae]UWS28435.1 flagellar transcriptional regulator FlhC [Erwinia pyrifoliae]
MSDKSLLNEIHEVNIAMELINLGARMQVLESETSISRRRLLRLYKELRGCPPPKGMLPFSEDWFMSWEQNIHSSMFYNIYLYLQKAEKGRPIKTLMKAYRLYLEQCYPRSSEKPVLGLTRAWTLLRFVGCGIISQKSCAVCKGGFVVATEFIKNPFTCSLCSPPSRALKKTQVNNHEYVSSYPQQLTASA